MLSLEYLAEERERERGRESLHLVRDIKPLEAKRDGSKIGKSCCIHRYGELPANDYRVKLYIARTRTRKIDYSHQ